MKPSEVYNKYRAIKQHFTSGYDYFKYHGKFRNADLNKRNDAWVFTNLARALQDKDVEGFFVAHMLENPNMWVGEMTRSEIFPNYKKKMLQLKQYFKEDVRTILAFCEREGIEFEDVFKINAETYPTIIKLVKQGYIQLETYILFNRMMNLQPHYDKHYEGNIMMEDFSKLVRNYAPFLGHIVVAPYFHITKETIGEGHDMA